MENVAKYSVAWWLYNKIIFINQDINFIKTILNFIKFKTIKKYECCH